MLEIWNEMSANVFMVTFVALPTVKFLAVNACNLEPGNFSFLSKSIEVSKSNPVIVAVISFWEWISQIWSNPYSKSLQVVYTRVEGG